MVTAIVGVVAVAAMLLTFPAMRAAGASLLASAGILGIVAGVAAQSTLSNMFAGLQIAFGDMVRLGDTVVVDGEWGTVEEITLTFLTVRTWDERRITMPVSYFTSKPFENWSRGTPQMTGIVFWHLDHSAPVELMREKLRDILRECPAWDGRDYGLAVTDTTPNTMQVRALVTAKDADDIWTVRVTVREQMVRWLSEQHPYALPRVNTADAALPADRRSPDGFPDGVARRRTSRPGRAAAEAHGETVRGSVAALRTPVDLDDLRGDMPRGRRGEPVQGRGHVAGGAGALVQGVPDKPLAPPGVDPRPEELGVLDVPGRDDVRGDPARSELSGELMGVRVQRGLGPRTPRCRTRGWRRWS